MTTFAQLVKKTRPKWKRKNKHILFQGRPFTAVKALLIKGKPTVRIMTPRKPNSAKRKYVRVGWHQSKSFGLKPIEFRTNAYVSGEIKSNEFQPQPNADLLIRGGRVHDLPGMKYTIVRGHPKSLKGLRFRKQSRSRYGAKLNVVEERKLVHKSFNYK